MEEMQNQPVPEPGKTYSSKNNSFTILSRLPVVMPGCHWRFIRTCYAIRVVLLWRIWE